MPQQIHAVVVVRPRQGIDRQFGISVEALVIAADLRFDQVALSRSSRCTLEGALGSSVSILHGNARSCRFWVKDIKVGFPNVNEGRWCRRPLSASFLAAPGLMPVIQAAVVASRSKDPTGCWGPTFLSKLDMDRPVVGFAVLDII
jgi:hypothetical protein